MSALILWGGGAWSVLEPGVPLQAQPPVATSSQPTLPSVSASATPTPEAEVQPTPAALLPSLSPNLFKEIIRARILLLLKAKAVAVDQDEHTIHLPLVLAEEASSADDSLPANTPAPTPVPLPTAVPDGTVRTVQVPILMYHYLSTPPDDADIYRRDLSVDPDRFAQHLDRLQAEGYSTIRLDDLYLHLVQGTPLPPKPVLLTFDDGYRDNYVNAFPLLAAQGMTATFFIVTDFIDEQRPEYLSWDMVREMYAGGMAIESHGRNHASLANRDDDYLIWQALGSLETIQHELGVQPRFISYPAGQYDENTIRIFQSAHYLAGVTTIQGATHHSDKRFELHRVRVRGTTDADELMRLLTLDW